MNAAEPLLVRLAAGLVTRSAEETRTIAAALATCVPANTVLALHGDLGVGKTTFVQGFALGLGIQEPMTSPTFTVFNPYRGPRGTFIHLDAYRLTGENEVTGLMLEDFLVAPWWMAAEWPERLGSWLPANAWHLRLSILREHTHEIRLLS